MKKLTAIFLLLTFMINLVGFRMMHYLQVKSSDNKMEVLLDNSDYLETDLVTLRVPLSLPYQNNSAEFERISGEVSFKGKIYKYVKRRIDNGDLVLMCLTDYNKMRLVDKKNELVKNSVDQAGNNSDKSGRGSVILKYTFSEFEENLSAIRFTKAPDKNIKYPSFNLGSMNSLQITAPGQPPDQLS